MDLAIKGKDIVQQVTPLHEGRTPVELLKQHTITDAKLVKKNNCY